MSEAEPPREGLEGSLPACLRIITFGDKAAIFHGLPCPLKTPTQYKFSITAGPFDEWATSTVHPETVTPVGWSSQLFHADTDDPAEAEAAWEKAARLVRTGALE